MRTMFLFYGSNPEFLEHMKREHPDNCVYCGTEYYVGKADHILSYHPTKCPLCGFDYDEIPEENKIKHMQRWHNNRKHFAEPLEDLK